MTDIFIRGCPLCGNDVSYDDRTPVEIQCQDCWLVMSHPTNNISLLVKKWNKRSRGNIKDNCATKNPFCDSHGVNET